jgi:hypothetical protein
MKIPRSSWTSCSIRVSEHEAPRLRTLFERGRTEVCPRAEGGTFEKRSIKEVGV